METTLYRNDRTPSLRIVPCNITLRGLYHEDIAVSCEVTAWYLYHYKKGSCRVIKNRQLFSLFIFSTFPFTLVPEPDLTGSHHAKGTFYRREVNCSTVMIFSERLFDTHKKHLVEDWTLMSLQLIHNSCRMSSQTHTTSLEGYEKRSHLETINMQNMHRL